MLDGKACFHGLATATMGKYSLAANWKRMKNLKQRSRDILCWQVLDAVNILRGIKEKYESYHGVRISDRALVVAAELSHRYIQNRFLPDKAIDLMDEAASNMRVQLESKPEDIDMMQRALYRLQVEERALSKEKDKVKIPTSTTSEGFPKMRLESTYVTDLLASQNQSS